MHAVCISKIAVRVSNTARNSPEPAHHAALPYGSDDSTICHFRFALPSEGRPQ